MERYAVSLYPALVSSGAEQQAILHEHDRTWKRSRQELDARLAHAQPFASVDDGSFWTKSRDAPDTPEIDRVRV